jgi:hypothetical protein
MHACTAKGAPGLLKTTDMRQDESRACERDTREDTRHTDMTDHLRDVVGRTTLQTHAPTQYAAAAS